MINNKIIFSLKFVAPKQNIPAQNGGSSSPQKRLYIKHGQLDRIGQTMTYPNNRVLAAYSNPNRIVNGGNQATSRISLNGSGLRGVGVNMNGRSVFTGVSGNFRGSTGQKVGSLIGSSRTPGLKLASILSGTMFSKNRPTGVATVRPTQSVVKTHPTTVNDYLNSNNNGKKVEKVETLRINPPITQTQSTKPISKPKVNEAVRNSEFLSRATNETTAKSAYKCKNCDLLFLNSFFLNEHLASKHHHSRKEDRVVYVDALDSCKHFTCSYCSVTTLDKISFLAHISMCSAT